MRYGSFRYGEAKYGASAFDTQLWALLVDWDGDGLYDWTNESSRMTDLRVTRGRRNMVRADGGGFEPVDIGRLTIELDNNDGRYHPMNMRSPLYPYVRPGVKMAVLTRLPTSGEIYPVFAGRIDDIVPISGRWDRVKLIALDGLAWLKDQDISLFIQSNQQLDDLVGTVLTAAQWPWGVDLESSTDTVPWFWAPVRRTVRDLLNELAETHLANVFIAADGSAKLYIRTHSLTSAKLRIEQDDLSGEVLVRVPWEVIKNRITLVSHPRTQQDMGEVWSLASKPEIADGETFEAWGTFSFEREDVPIAGYETPVAGTDYQVNTESDGSGDDLTASCSVSVIVYANSAVIRLTNNSGSAGIITKLQLRGQALMAQPLQVLANDNESQALYGPKSLVIDSPFLQDTNLAQTIADALIAQLAEAQVHPTVTIENRPEIQYTLDLFDFVDLVIDQVDVSGLHRLAYIEHRWTSENGQASISTFGFEPVVGALDTVWTFPATIGVDTIFAF